MRALVAVLAFSLAACSMRDTRFDGVPESHFLGRTEADITKEYGAPSVTMWRSEFDALDPPAGCTACGARINSAGILQFVDGRARIYRISRTPLDSAWDAQFTELARKCGEATLLRRLYSDGQVRSAWREIVYRVEGNGGGLSDQSFRMRFDLNGKCTLAALTTD
ncbi:MAG: hypothetical protein EPO68_10400 [Planctomycetota bacterium]|nr:MAG: hypothetical protein EPO68_10400 [Planctomycetota bacterium]